MRGGEPGINGFNMDEPDFSVSILSRPPYPPILNRPPRPFILNRPPHPFILNRPPHPFILNSVEG